MKCALSAKCNEGRFVLVESLASSAAVPPEPQQQLDGRQRRVGGGPAASADLVRPDAPKAIATMIKGLVRGAGRAGAAGALCSTALLVDCGEHARDGGRPLRVAAASVGGCEVMSVEELTVYHVLKYNALVVTRPALALLTSRLASPSHRNKLPAKKRWWEKELRDMEQAAAALLSGSLPRKVNE